MQRKGLDWVIYRDDDISRFTDYRLLDKVHGLFLEYNKIHTVAVEMEGLWENKLVWFWLMTAKNLDIGLHCWRHEDYSQKSENEINRLVKQSLGYWHSNIERGGYTPRPIKKFYPPWNRVCPALYKVCKQYGLEVDNRVGGEVFNFHWWEFIEKERWERLTNVLRD